MEASGDESSVTQSISSTLPSNTGPVDRGSDIMAASGHTAMQPIGKFACYKND